MRVLRQTLCLFTILTVAIIGVSTAVKAGELATVKPAYGGELSFVLLKPDNPKAAVVLFPGSRGYLDLDSDGDHPTANGPQ